MYNQNHIKSFSVVVFDKKKILYEYHKNSSSIKLYETASVTKLITATLTQILVEKNLMNINDKIIDIYQDINIEPMDWLKNITIENLVTHTAGFPDLRYYSPKKYYNYQKIGVSFPNLIYPPSKHYRYSNQGFILLGKIIEEKCKLKINECAKKYIYEPLSMKYSRGPITGAAGFVTNIEDIVKFGQMYLNFGTFNNNRVLSFDSILEFFKPCIYIPESSAKFYTGRGWRIKLNPVMFTMFHIGGTNFVSAWLQLFPYDGYGLAYLGSPPTYNDTVMGFLSQMQTNLGLLTAAYAGRDAYMILWEPPTPKDFLFEQFPGTYQEVLTGEILEIDKYKDYVLKLKSRNNYSYLLYLQTHHIFYSNVDTLTNHFILNETTNNVEYLANIKGFYKKIQ